MSALWSDGSLNAVRSRALPPSSGHDIFGSTAPTVVSSIRPRQKCPAKQGMLDGAALSSGRKRSGQISARVDGLKGDEGRSEEHTSELQSLMRISYAVFCLKKKNNSSTIDKNNEDR